MGFTRSFVLGVVTSGLFYESVNRKLESYKGVLLSDISKQKTQLLKVNKESLGNCTKEKKSRKLKKRMAFLKTKKRLEIDQSNLHSFREMGNHYWNRNLVAIHEKLVAIIDYDYYTKLNNYIKQRNSTNNSKS